MELSPNTLKKPHDPKLEAIAGFLTLDVLALTAFGFAGFMGSVVLRIVGFFLAILIFPYLRYHLKDFKLSVHPIICMVAFLLLGMSYFWMTFFGANILYGILFNLLTSVGLIGFFLLGGGVKHLPKLKKEYIALALLSGLALLVIITTIYSISRYGFFYAAIYKGQVYYYDGVVFPVASEGKYLDGFLFRETSLSFAMVPSFLLACTGVSLIALRPKDGWRFYVMIGFAGVGLLSLILVPYVFGLILLIPVYLVFLIHYIILWRLPGKENVLRRAKIAKVIFIILVILAALLVVTLMIDTFMGSNGFLKKIPLFYLDGNPRRLGVYVDRMEAALSAAMFKTAGGVRTFNFLGFLFGAPASEVTKEVISQNIFEFSIFYQNGFLGFLGMLFLIFFGIYHGFRYVDLDEDRICRKMALTAILLGMFIYFSFVNDENPLLHAYHLDELFSYHNSILVATSRSTYFLLGAFLLGYIYTPKTPEEALHKKGIAAEKPAEIPSNDEIVTKEVEAHE